MAITRLNNNSASSITTLSAVTSVPNLASLPSGLVANTPYWSARETSLQTLSHGVETKATLSTEINDSDGAYDTSNSRFTVPTGKGGKYFTFFQIDLYDADSDITNLTAIIKMSNTTRSKVYTDFSNGSVPSHAHLYVSLLQEMSAGDYLEYYIYMTTNNASSAQSYGGEWGTMCGGYRIIE